MHKYLISFSFLSLLFCCFYSCSYDKIEPRCEDLPPSKNDVVGYNFSAPKYNYVAASFNPSNSNEVLFYRKGWGTIDICIYNTQSNELKTVYTPSNGFGTGSPQWGNNNWIFFPMKDRQIWKIKSNGDSLTQVTQYPLCFNNIFNTKENKLLYRHMWNIPQYSTMFYISDEQGTVLDSLSCAAHIGIFAWQNSKNIASIAHLDVVNPIGTIQVINPETNERTDVSSYNYNDNGETGICWIDENTLIYMLEDGVYKVDIPSKKNSQLRRTCETQNYGSPSYSPTLGKIVATKTNLKIIAENLVEVTNRLCLLDTDGKELEMLEIPE